MAKHPYAAPVKTRLNGHISDEKRVSLYVELLDSTVAKLKNIPETDTFISFFPPDKQEYFDRFGLPVFPQADGDIGDKMHQAFLKVYGIGYQKAAVVGVDIPKLSKDIILRAFELLDRSDIVFGPAADGGYYLVAMKSPEERIFTAIQWSSHNTLRQSFDAAARHNLVVELVETLSDVDTIEDAKKAGLI